VVRLSPVLLLTVAAALARPGNPPGPAGGPAAVPVLPPDTGLVEEVLDLSDHTVVLSVDDGYHSVFTDIYPLLKRHRMTMTLGIITDYIRSGEPSHARVGGYLRRSEIQELLDSCGIEIASHGMSHPFLARVDSAMAWREIRESKAILESLFGTEVITFIYPYGNMNHRVRRMVRQAGYKLGRAVRPGDPDLWSDRYRIPEVELRLETRLEDIKARIRRRPVTVLLLHQVADQPTVFTQWSTADFTVLLEWLNRNQVRVTTLGGLYREWWTKHLDRFLERVAAAYPDGRKQLLFQDVDVDATEAAHPR